MSGRPFLGTLAALFLLAGGGQVIGALGVTSADAGRSSMPLPEDAVPLTREVTSGGIIVRDEREAATDPGEEQAKDLVAKRIELRQAAAEMKVERERMERERSALEAARRGEQEKLAALYARMPAKKAASIMASLDPAVAAGFVAAMPGSAGAEILSQMPDAEAVAVTRALVAAGTAESAGAKAQE